ncbi:hypothetical protein [Mesorhizobium sp. M0053]|uniref:hypothetical protein n=1 Tax=Mesorhizobium sp. M0053 TaxID=2956864 RepID=UPI00333BD678
MPGLSGMLDSDALENRYLGKVVLYVESENDANFYRQCLAIGQDEYVEFKGIPGQGGYRMAIARATEERTDNDLVFALVDGEAAAGQQGGLAVLLACDTKAFQVPGEKLDGVIFLGEHELENILIRLSDVCRFIAHDDGLGDVGKKDPAALRKQLAAMVDRQLAGAVCKYASMKMTCEGNMTGALGAVFWDDPKKVTPWMVRKQVRDKGGDWKAYVAEVKAIRAEIATRLAAMTPDAAAYHRLRLADGKSILSLLGHCYKVSKKWHGHLTMEIVGNPYFEELRSEIYAMTRKAA